MAAGGAVFRISKPKEPINRVELSADGKHRFLLYSKIPSNLRWIKRIVFVMINPSTADARFDDATIRKCKAIALQRRATDMYILNLFSFRTPDVKALTRYLKATIEDDEFEIMQAENQKWHDEILNTKCDQEVIVAWGKHNKVPGFAADAAYGFYDRQFKLGQADRLKYLQLNEDGSPRHPLYIAKDTELKLYTFPGYAS